ncbi:PAS domain S-box protein [Martelella sp. HB161492]|uniref:PAS domain S-box protein n=1 Tax=Martelella sp. HB161492 TaxID=2720726 RepID=UPI0015921A0C
MEESEQLEEKRLKALYELNVLDSAPEPEFEALVQAAAIVCGTPISLISLLERDRQWFKANVGLEDVTETPRSVSFCAHAIKNDSLMEVQDATRDPRFSDNPLVTGSPDIRFYAGVPLTLSSGEKVGTLCVIDTKAKALSEEQKAILSHLATAAVRALEIRMAALHEKELVSLEWRAQSILENSFDAVLSMDCRGRIQHWNRAAERMFGFSAEQAEGQPLDLILPPEKRESEGALLKRLDKNLTSRSFRTERQHKNGDRLPVSISIGPVLDSDGVMVGATEIIRDISDIEKTNRELADAERRVRRLYQSTPAMLHSIDAEGRLLSVSDRWLEVMGYSRDEVIGRLSSSFMTEESHIKSTTEMLPAFLKSGHCEDIEYQMVTRAGDVIDVLLSAILERDADGKPMRSMAIIENITARRKAEKALRTERRRLAQIIQATQAGTWEWNVETGELRLNRQWASIIGEQPDSLGKVTIQTWLERLHPDDDQLSRDRLAEHFAGKTENYQCEVRLRHNDGHWVWVLGRGQVISRTHDGKPEWMFGTHQDISQRKAEEQELRKSREFLDRTGRLAGVGGWELNLETQDLFWSDETCRIHGVALGHKPDLAEAISYYAPEAREAVDAAVTRSIATGESFDIELPLINAKGDQIFVRSVGSTQFENGKPIRVAGAFQDITERVSQRKALEEVNERIAVATENGRIGIWDANLVTGKTLYSEIWCSLIGYRQDEVPDNGFEWLNFIHPDDMERAKNSDAAHIRGEAPYFEEQFRMRHKDGHWVWILDRGRVTARDEDGNPTRMIGTHTDITRQKQQEEERFLLGERMAIATTSGGIGIWELNIETGEPGWDPIMYELYGHSGVADESVAVIWQRQVHLEDRERVREAVATAIAEESLLDEEYRVVWPDGSVHHLHIAARVVAEEQQRPRRMIGAAWDVTDERQLALELAEQHELMRVTLHSIGDAVITTNADGVVQWLNPVAERMTGWSLAEARDMASSRVFNIVHEETRQQAPDPIRACLELASVVGLQEDTLLLARDGIEYGIEDSAAPIRSKDGEVLGAVLVFHDVSEQRRLSREMSYRASHDQLTGLINRSEFDRRLTRLFDKTMDGRGEHVLLFIDLDQFKIVNDSCGHSVGDDLLRKVSALMVETVRAEDTVARLGGDEFAILLEYCTPDVATAIAQAICDKMNDFRFVHDGRAFRVGTSIGLVPITSASLSVPAILQAADTACYAAKEAGRNRVQIWSPDNASKDSERGETRWSARLEQALEQEGFELHVQNIFGLPEDNTPKYAEVLLRLKGENGEIIRPNAFLSSAERFNLITRIDHWVVAHVISYLEQHGSAENAAIERYFVNISARAIGDRSFHRFVIERLEHTDQTVRERLCFEITEQAAISNMTDVAAFAEAARALGVAIALDDFGAGGSSFGYLKRLPVDFLKFEGRFAQGLEEDPLNAATIRSFVEVTAILSLRCIAKFIPDTKTAIRLADLGVGFGQSYLFHKPEPLQN